MSKDLGLFLGGALVGLVIGSLSTAVTGWPHVGKCRAFKGAGLAAPPAQ
ncbi:MAG TPA: hypothetical protein VMB05_18380 [Solirubrobacteraceae bacterium]|nr:hypothetical protein [Solirubrobacteraceae bacterium]